jgi:transglutaminase-like putative cysteine protease
VNSFLVYRAGFYVMMTVATTALCADTSDDRGGWLLPPVVAAAGLAAFLTVDRRPEWALPRSLATLLGLGSLVLLYVEYSMDETQLIRCLGHWLVSLQLIKYFLPKRVEDDWVLFLVGLMQVLIGAVINMGDQVGVWLFLWAVLAIWVLGQFFLQRESRRFLAPSGADARSPMSAPARDPYVGLFDASYFWSALQVLGLTLALGYTVFLILPRQQGVTRARFGPTAARHLTGFDEEVMLGQLGEILENDTPVMTVEFVDADKAPTRPPVEPLWRGVTLNSYEKGRWRRQNYRSPRTFASYRERIAARRPTLRQIIKLEPNDSPTLFGLRPFVLAESGHRLGMGPQFSAVDGTIYRNESRGSYDYEVVSEIDPNLPQAGEDPPGEDRVRNVLLEISDELRAALEPIARPIVAQHEGDGPEAVEARARALEAYLHDPARFSYTLDMGRVDYSLDPIVDFLVNRREGHCEYFGSALTMLLRSVGIPSRMVNGFKGGDWNDFTQIMTVRQKHAHTWVEAYLGRDAEGRPRWITLDPTPGLERDESVAQVGGLASRFRGLTDVVRYVWVFYVLGYDANRQAKLYSPVKWLFQEVREGFGMLAGLGGDAFSMLFGFKNLRSFVSVRGFVVSFIVLLLVAALFRGLVWLVKRLMTWWRGPADDLLGSSGVDFYRRLVQLLAAYDLKRAPAETQGEFANRAFRLLRGREGGDGDGDGAIAELPEKVVEAFYQVRFGRRELSPETLAELEKGLDLLEARLAEPAAG